jgi:hypothetical protein
MLPVKTDKTTRSRFMVGDLLWLSGLSQIPLWGWWSLAGWPFDV